MQIQYIFNNFYLFCIDILLVKINAYFFKTKCKLIYCTRMQMPPVFQLWDDIMGTRGVLSFFIFLTRVCMKVWNIFWVLEKIMLTKRHLIYYFFSLWANSEIEGSPFLRIFNIWSNIFLFGTILTFTITL